MAIFQVAAAPASSMQDDAYVESMVAKAEGRAPVAPAAATPVAPEATPTETPKMYAGKYKSVEEMEAGYLALQKAYSAKAPAAPATPAAPEVTPPVAPVLDADGNEVTPAAPTAEEAAAAAALESKGLDLSTFNAEFMEKGELSAESYAALEAAGIPQTMVDNYIAGQQLIAQNLVTQVFDSVGGEAEYQSMMQWAKDNLTPDAKAAYQAALDTNDINQVLLAVKGLQASYVEVQGRPPQLLNGDGTDSTGDVYASMAEMKADMRDPRYQKDPAFRAKVAAKLGRSDIM